MSKTMTTAYLALTTAAYAMLGLMGPFLACFAFDAPGPEHDPRVVLIGICLAMLFPICGASIIGSWIAYARNRQKAALWATVVPPLAFVLLVIVGSV
jgi:hypothetical protein